MPETFPKSRFQCIVVFLIGFVAFVVVVIFIVVVLLLYLTDRPSDTTTVRGSYPQAFKCLNHETRYESSPLLYYEPN